MNNAVSLQELFANRLFRVPDYQRGYSWSERNWDDFLEDLDLLAAGKLHYTGTIVLDRIHKPPAGEAPTATVIDRSGRAYEEFDIVDGQQRLTTIVLLLDTIRRELAALPDLEPLAMGTSETYIQVTSPAGEPLQKLRLNADTDTYWRDSVLADVPSPAQVSNASQERLAGAKGHFAAHLDRQRSVLGPDYPAWLQQLRTKVTSNLVFVLYEVSTSAEVGVIFEVMNDRGKPLTELEKAKNYLLYVASKLDLADHGLAQLVNSSWAEILSRLMRAGLSDPRYEDQLLRSHWLTVYDYDRRSWHGTASIKARLNLRDYVGRHEELLAAATDYVKTLRDASLAYAEILHPQDAFGPPLTGSDKERYAVRDASRRLLRLGATATFLPVLIATRLRYPEDGEHYRAVVDLCERYSFRVYRLLERYSNAGQSALFRLGYRIYHGERDREGTVGRLRELIHYYSPVDKIAAVLSDSVELNWYGHRGLKYLLYEWELHLAGPHAVLLDWESVEQRDRGKSIEHILPQTPTDAYWEARFDVAARKRLTHDLGNLVLTEDNSTYSNKAFPNKRGTVGLRRADGSLAPCYSNSNLFQEKALAALDDWTPAAIDLRRSELLEWARERWDVPGGVTTHEGVDPEEVEQDEASEA